MGRTQIELSFYDKEYTIEYNRAGVKYVIQNMKDDIIDQALIMVRGGLFMHHEKEMPTDDEILGWILALGDDLKVFYETLQGMVQGVLDTFKEDRKNLKWGKVEA